jgi:hypothetical protein
MSKLRYTACTSDPDDFVRDKYTLRPFLYGRQTELFIVSHSLNLIPPHRFLSVSVSSDRRGRADLSFWWTTGYDSVQRGRRPLPQDHELSACIPSLSQRDVRSTDLLLLVPLILFQPSSRLAPISLFIGSRYGSSFFRLLLIRRTSPTSAIVPRVVPGVLTAGSSVPLSAPFPYHQLPDLPFTLVPSLQEKMCCLHRLRRTRALQSSHAQGLDAYGCLCGGSRQGSHWRKGSSGAHLRGYDSGSRQRVGRRIDGSRPDPNFILPQREKRKEGSCFVSTGRS